MSHRRFLTELSRQMPGSVTMERTKAVRAFERDLEKDFPIGALTSSLAPQVIAKLSGFPTYTELKVAIQSVLGGQSAHTGSRHSREITAWLVAFINRYEATSDPDRRACIVSAFKANAPAEVLAAARQDYPQMFPRRDELAEDTAWWWGRIDRLEEMPPSLRLAHAQGMHRILTRYQNDGEPIHDPAVINAVRGIVEELVGDGVQPADGGSGPIRGGWKPQTVHQATGGAKTSAKAPPPVSADAVKRLILPTPKQHAEALLATIRAGDAANARIAQLRFNSLVDHYPGEWSHSELVRMTLRGEFNDENGNVVEAKIEAVRKKWAKERDQLMQHRRDV
jgi:hypothetical protein